MNIVIRPHRLSGRVEVPCSKSYAHRLLIAAALSDEPTEVRMNALNKDILATADCLRAMGARIEPSDSGYFVHPIASDPSPRELFCGESGSTLRFLIPVAAALGQSCTFTGAGRLPFRPNAPLVEAINAHGACADNPLLPMRISGQLRGGSYAIAGNVSSQYITGLMFALPLCPEDSAIRLTTPLESAAYIDITLDVLRRFGITVEPVEGGWRIGGGQRYRSPGAISAEGDWSGATFWYAANRLGSDVVCDGLNPESAQGDRRILEMLSALGGTLNVSDTPDLVPALAVAAAVHPAVTRIVGAARLRMKESDRLSAISRMLGTLGTRVEELEDGLVIHGGTPLTGGTVEGCNDHRIVMAAAIAGTVASGPVIITDAEAVSKSYPAFFEEFTALGGMAHVEPDR